MCVDMHARYLLQALVERLLRRLVASRIEMLSDGTERLHSANGVLAFSAAHTDMAARIARRPDRPGIGLSYFSLGLDARGHC